MYLGGGQSTQPTLCRQTQGVLLNSLLDADLLDADSCHVTCDACWEATPPDRMTDACENITLPQTSFAAVTIHVAQFYMYQPHVIITLLPSLRSMAN